jgi:hypothetical protein
MWSDYELIDCPQCGEHASAERGASRCRNCQMGGCPDPTCRKHDFVLDTTKRCLCDGLGGSHTFRANGCNFGPGRLRSHASAFR